MMVILMEEMDVVNYVLWSNYMFVKEDHWQDQTSVHLLVVVVKEIWMENSVMMEIRVMEMDVHNIVKLNQTMVVFNKHNPMIYVSNV